ncbi:Creatinase/aminopeptidase [Mycena amicta]|nr:Creatinase/aminopeptidase [Mycena amicta]
MSSKNNTVALPSPKQRSYLLTVVLIGCLLWYALGTSYHRVSAPVIDPHCSHLGPISAEEFETRQTALARTLIELNAAAYIAEPGASFTYYGNATWSLSERPLLLIVTPQRYGNDVKAKISILTPAFEATAREAASQSHVEWIEWAEEASPYDHVMSILPSSAGAVFVDGRNKNIHCSTYEIKRLRERKSSAELELLKCANERLYFGIRESTARAMMAETLTSAGLNGGGCLTLFGENAALPHGAGTDKALGTSDFALFDCTGSLHAPSGSQCDRLSQSQGSNIPSKHLDFTAAIQTAHAGVAAKDVDRAARSVHEDPYLNGGSKTILETGHSFSDEPGYYVVGKVGVRLEDCFYIHENGSAVFLTAGVGGQAHSPWNP